MSEPETAQSLKDLGNAKFKEGQFAAAIAAYTDSIDMDPSQHLCYSNRSAAYLKLGGRGEEAVQDAIKCTELNPSWPKGYSRLAAALQDLKRWDEAVAACEKGLSLGPGDDGLQKMLEEVENRRFQDSLQGAWHGTVSEALGGYDQEMRFVDHVTVHVEVMGKAIEGKYWVDCKHTPHHLNVQVPIQEPGMPMQPPPPAVPYIAKIEDDGLHLCCPYPTLNRPETFDGPGFCLMQRGPVEQQEDPEVAGLSRDERLKLCVEEVLKVVPEAKLEEISQTDSEEKFGEKLMAHVRFESSMFSVQKRFGEETLKEVFAAAVEGINVPDSLVGSPQLALLKEKLTTCGMVDASGGLLGPSSPPQAREPPSAREPAGKEDVVANDPAPSAKDAIKKDHDVARSSSSATNSSLPIAVAVTALLALGVTAAVLWRQRRK
mmetsp:Transcript_39581/g.104900  ORF Transcript_39581/g.104900 Transcript_39581/m.104900 type:complete len:432 (-) Transcript_39581:268-1563(-)